MKVKPSNIVYNGLGKLSLLLFWILCIAACSPRMIPLKVVVPSCPPPHKPVIVQNGSISGEYVINAVDNHTEDHICLDRLRVLLGGQKK